MQLKAKDYKHGDEIFSASCCVVLRCVLLCCIVLCCIVLFWVVFCCVAQCCVVLRCVPYANYVPSF